MAIELKRARELLARFPRKKILVVGDLMLDRYIYGAVSRISPEAPVPVVHVSREFAVPGGATNVAHNIRAIGGGSAVAGIIGSDKAGSELAALLRKSGVGLRAVQKLAGHPTTVKTRIVAERQQVVRVDWESRLVLSRSQLAVFCRRVEREMLRADGVIIEDYGKGLIRQEIVSAVLKAAKRRGIPVGLDPKDNEELNVAGVTLATPNRKEAFFAANVEDPGAKENPLRDEALFRVGRILLRKWRPGLLAITLGPHGMLLLEKDKPPKHVPTRAREVFDVSGAGDTVIGACTLAVAAGATFEEAAEIANYAAGVVVGKVGAATCTPEELIAYMQRG